MGRTGIQSLVSLKHLTFGFFVFPGGPPANAGFVVIQEIEADQPLGAASQLHHLSASLHGAHASFHCQGRREKASMLAGGQLGFSLFL